MRIQLFCSIFITASFLSYSQSVTDSLTDFIESIPTEEEKSIAYYDAAIFLRHSNPLKCLEFGHLGLNLAQRISYSKGIVKNSIIIAKAEFHRDSLKSALLVLHSLDEIKTEFFESIDLLNYHLYLGLIHEYVGNPIKAIDEYLKCYNEAVLKADTLWMGMTMNNLAGMYAQSKDYHRALESQRIALNHFKQIGQEEYLTNSYINMSYWNQDLHRTDSSLYYLRIARNRLQKTKDNYGLIHAYEAYALTYQDMGFLDSAIAYYHKGLNVLRNHPESRIEAAVYSKIYLLMGLARTYSHFDINDSAYTYINAAYNEAKANDLISRFGTIYEPMSQIYAIQGYADSALALFKLHFEFYNDELKNRNEQKVANILLQNEIELERKENELSLKENKQERILIILFFGFSIGVLVIAIALIIQRLRIQKQRAENEGLKLEASELKNEKLKNELDLKRKELGTKMLYLVQKNEFISSISKRLKDINNNLNETGKKEMYQILNELESGNDNDAWEEFEMRFQDIHKEFYAQLAKRYPNITSNDMRLCAFLKLNLSTKEIAKVTYQNPESINTARYRLRKKLGLGRETNLVSFLNSI